MAAGKARSGLELGPQVRSRRAELKRAMRGDLKLALAVVAGGSDVWEDVARDMAVEQLLNAIPGVEPAVIDKTLDTRGIPPSVRVYGLTDERRQEIAGALRKAMGL